MHTYWFPPQPNRIALHIPARGRIVVAEVYCSCMPFPHPPRFLLLTPLLPPPGGSATSSCWRPLTGATTHWVIADLLLYRKIRQRETTDCPENSSVSMYTGHNFVNEPVSTPFLWFTTAREITNRPMEQRLLRVVISSRVRLKITINHRYE